MHASIARLVRCLVLPAVLAGCAASVPVAPARLQPLATAAPEVVVESNVEIRLSTAYVRTVPERSRWRAVGTLPQGTVYQPLNTVFAIEGRNVHEAWLVLRDGAVQGFYLPAEGNYSPLTHPVSLSTTGGR